MVPGGCLWESSVCTYVGICMCVCVCIRIGLYMYVCVCVLGLRQFHYFVEFYMSGLVLEARVHVVYMHSMAFFHP